MSHDPGDPMLSGPTADDAKSAHVTVEPPYISVPAILKVGAGLAVLVAVSMAAMWGFLKWLSPPEHFTLAPATEAPAPGEPGVDADQTAHRLEYEAKQQELLTSYGWIDKEKGIARIPIERAMELMRKDAKEMPAKSAKSEPEDAK